MLLNNLYKKCEVGFGKGNIGGPGDVERYDWWVDQFDKRGETSVVPRCQKTQAEIFVQKLLFEKCDRECDTLGFIPPPSFPPFSSYYSIKAHSKIRKTILFLKIKK